MRKKWGKIVVMALICGGCLTACATGKQENNPTTKESKATGSIHIIAPGNNKKKDNPKKLKNIKLSVDRWDTKKADFSIEAIRFGTGGGGVVDFGQNWEFIAYEENLSTVLEKNPKYFVGLLEYTDNENEKHKAARYFKNNNSYILYEKDEKGRKHNYLCLVNQMLTLDYPKNMSGEYSKYVSFPYPCYNSLSNWEIEAAWEKNEDLLEEKFWGLYSYEELKKFYRNFEKTTAKCSDENQTIRVKAMEHNNDKKTGDVNIVIDFKHKNFVVKDSRGKKIFEEADIWKAFEKQYTSAGKVGKKEFFYDKWTNILCVEEGKRTLCIDEDTRDTLFEVDGFNCVGKGMKVKVSPKSNSQKIYLDVTLYMEEEDAEWEVQATLMLDSKGKYVKRVK